MKPKKKIPEDLVEIFSDEDVPQRSEEWLRLRMGIPTASKYPIVMAEGKDGEDSKTREDYLDKLAGEILTEQINEEFKSEAMKRGVIMEPEALDWYERTHFVDLERIGFVRRTVYPPLGDPFVTGCSPDARVAGTGKLIEVKTLRPDLLVKIVRNGGFPSKHRAQCQGSMWVTGAETCDLILYYRGWKAPPVYTIERDERYIARLAEEVERFVYELKVRVKDVKSRGKGW